MARRMRRLWLWILLAVLALPVAGIAALWLLVDAEALRPRLVAAVERATGRNLTIGEMSLALSLVPTVELRDVALANAPGGSRPQMLTAERVQVQAALLPLLSRRIEIARVVLEAPDLLLETDAQGRGNWQFTPAAEPAAPAQPSAEPVPEATAPGTRMSLAVDSLRLVRGRVTWRDGRMQQAETVEIPTLEAAAPADGPIRAEGNLVVRGQQIAVDATGGQLAALGGEAPWPVQAVLRVTGAEARVQGTLAAGNAWTGEFAAQVPDLARLAPLLPDMPLPPLREVSLTGRASGNGGTVTAAEALVLRVGESDLSVLRPELRLRRLEVTAANLQAPLTLAAEATLGATALRASGTAGTPAILLGRRAAPLPLDLRLQTEGAEATLQGRVAEPQALAGVDLALTAQAADLSTLSPLAGTSLPALRDLRVQTRIAERTPGFQGGAHLRSLIVTAAQGEIRGDITLVVGERPGITGRLASRRIDLDAVLASLPASAAPPSGATPATPPRPPLPERGSDGRLIPDLPLPMAALRMLDADLILSVNALTAGGQAWRDIEAHLGLDTGRGRIAPLSFVTPAGPVALQIEADVVQNPPMLRLVARSDAFDMAGAARAAGAAPMLSGQAQIDLDLRGRGGDLRAVAATAGGHAGLALVDGSLSREALRGIPQEVLNALLPAGTPSGDIPLRCLALRAPAEGGVLRAETLYAEGALGRIGGAGALDLRDETLAVRLTTDLRAGRVAVRAPVTIAGRLAAPRIGVDPAAAAAAGLGAFLSQQRTPDRTLQGLAEALSGANRGGPALPDCATALAAARGGRAGAAPTTAGPAEPAAEAPAPAPAETPAVPGVPPALQGPAGELLRGLLGR